MNRADKQVLIDKLTSSYKTLETAQELGCPTRTAGLHKQRCTEIMEAITDAIVELDCPTPRTEKESSDG